MTPQKIIINLAPADIKKEGPSFDLPIALGILAASGYIKEGPLKQNLFVGELALDGSLRKIKGALPIAQLSRQKNISIVLPCQNAAEASLEECVSIYCAGSLLEVVRWINGEESLKKISKQTWKNQITENEYGGPLDFSEVKGQYHAKRAIEIAASGFHNLIFIGPPGAGKTMLAKRIPTVLPDLNHYEYLEISKIYSAAGLLPDGTFAKPNRPFRAPHHSISLVGLVGGGSCPRPGEITLAHHGVLFLDEFPEFRRDAIESLRAPIEDRCVLISRAKNNVIFPANFLTVCAMNPCPCGQLTNPKRPCRCTMSQIQHYHHKISGPILDRIDLHVEIPAIEYKDLTSPSAEESSSEIKRRVHEARRVQSERFSNSFQKTNSTMTQKDIRMHCNTTEQARKLLEQAMRELRLSARGYHKILKVGRTIADLEKSDLIEETHIAEAIQYRSLDRQWWS